MAQIFDYSDFIFDGVSSEFYSVQIVSTDDAKSERQFGLNSSFEYEDGVGDHKIFVKRKNDRYNFDVEIMKVVGDIPVAVPEKEYDKIIGWLMTDTPKPFIVGGICHYGTFNNGREFHNRLRQGIIKLKFESATPYPYSKLITNIYNVKGSKTIELENKSNIKKQVYIDIEIEKTKENGNIEIISKKINKSFKVKNITLGEKLRVLGEGCREIESITNKTRNVFKDLEYDDFPCIVYGKNKFEVVGDCKIKITYQYPIALR